MFQRLLQSKIFTILSGLLLLLLAFNILKAWLPLKQLEKEVANIKNKIMLIKKIATRRFLRKVNTLESIPLTPNAFRKIDTPEIKAVPKTVC